MSWSEHFAVGTRAVAERHQRVVDLLNQLHEEKCAGNRGLGVVLDELVDAAICAFSFEDVALQRACDESYAAHRREHEELVDTLTTLLYEHERLGYGLRVCDMRFIAELFCNHLLEVRRPCDQGEQCRSIAASDCCVSDESAESRERLVARRTSLAS